MGNLKEKYLKDGNLAFLRDGTRCIVFEGAIHWELTVWNFKCYDDKLNNTNNAFFPHGGKESWDIMVITDLDENVLWERDDDEVILDKEIVFDCLSSSLNVSKSRLVLDLELSEETNIIVKY